MSAAEATEGAERVISVARSIESGAQDLDLRDSEDATALFGHAGQLKFLEVGGGEMQFSSPLIAPQSASDETETSLGAVEAGKAGEERLEAMQLDAQDAVSRQRAPELEVDVRMEGEKGLGLGLEMGVEMEFWEEEVLRSPEKIGVEELEGLFDDY